VVEDACNDTDFVRAITGECEAKITKKASINMTLATLFRKSKKHDKTYGLITYKKTTLAIQARVVFYSGFKVIFSKTLNPTQANLLIQSCHALVDSLAFDAHDAHVQP